MNPITKLLREQKEEFEKLGELYSVYSFGTMDLENKTDEVNDWHTTAQQQLIDVIIGIMKESMIYEIYGKKFISDNDALQTQINRLEEAKKNV